MGVLALRSPHARPSAQPPIDTSGILQHMCLWGGIKNAKHISLFIKKTLKNQPLGAGGVPQMLFNPKSYFLCDLKPHRYFNILGEREKNAVYSGNLVPWQRTQAAWTKRQTHAL
jgi:hypothetical protein